MQPEQIIIEPIITEKAVLGRAISRYVFKVNPLAKKIAIKQAIEKIFKVKVVDVNTCHIQSKKRGLGRSIGRTTRWKKAYVTLIAGQKISELEA